MGILIKAPTRRTDTGLQLAMPAANSDIRVALHIREVVRITGLRREQLYMWQRRYGFPNPARDGFGDRVYPPDQVSRLRGIHCDFGQGFHFARPLSAEEVLEMATHHRLANAGRVARAAPGGPPGAPEGAEANGTGAGQNGDGAPPVAPDPTLRS